MTERTPGPVEVNEIETRIDGIGHVTTYALVDAKGRSIVDALNATASEIRSEYDEVDGTASHWDGEAEANLEFIAEAWNSHDTLLSDNKRLTDEIEQARAYATRLAVSVGARCFPEVPEWRPLPDLLGVLTQLDNMTCGMARAALSPVATGRDEKE